MEKSIQLKEYMDAWSQNGYFNGAVLVAHQGKIILSMGAGFANFEHEVPNTTKTKFRIGSLTKGFTCAAIMKLQERNLLSVHDPINQYLPDFPSGDQITIHHLMNHTSGIPNFTSFPDYWTEVMRLPTTRDQVIKSFEHLPLEFKPGEQFAYSNSAYLLLTLIIENVSEMPYQEYLKQRIFQPLDMKDTGCEVGDRAVIKHLATGYSVWENVIHTEYVDMSIPLGGYGCYSTVEDLLKWDQALYDDQLLSESSRKQMFTPYLEDYGYGWAICDLPIGEEKKKCMSHFGDISGFSNNLFRFVDDQLTIIVLSNLNITPVTKIAQDLAKICFNISVEVPKTVVPIKLSTAQCKHVLGAYITESNMEIQISLVDSTLYITMPKRYGVLYKYAIIPIQETAKQIEFVTEMIPETCILQKNERGEFDTLIYTDVYGQQYIAKKLSNEI